MLPLVLALCLATGGRVAAQAVPDVRGSYRATFTKVEEGEHGGRSFISCAGTLTITSQEGARFSGSFRNEPQGDCAPALGSVEGSVGSAGELSLSLLALHTERELDPFVVFTPPPGHVTPLSRDPGLTGLVRGDTLQVSMRAIIDYAVPVPPGVESGPVPQGPSDAGGSGSEPVSRIHRTLHLRALRLGDEPPPDTLLPSRPEP